jgi:hypothetical protein
MRMVMMNDQTDPGIEAAEEIVEQQEIDYYSDLADAES